MKQYLELVQDVLDNGEQRGDRTGTGTLSVFGRQRRYDLREGFPLLTTKRVYFRSVIHELLWFLKGSTNIHEGLSPRTKIWDPWADSEGNVGRIYGAQWRDWGGVDQIREAIQLIKHNPESRRIIVSAWNVTDLPGMALPPCHLLFQFYVVNGRLDCQLYQRSADIALGVPFNIASYALLMTMIARICDLTPGVFVHTMGDAHIYRNHVEGLKEQLTRAPLALPTIEVPSKDIDAYTLGDIKVHDYNHHNFIKFPISV